MTKWVKPSPSPPAKPNCAWARHTQHHRKEGAPEGTLQFDAVFEGVSEVVIHDLAAAEIEKSPLK